MNIYLRVMKKHIIALFTFLCVITPSFSQSRVANNTVCLRVKASIYTHVLDTIPRGARVYLIDSDISSGWSQVVFNKQIGYVQTAFLMLDRDHSSESRTVVHYYTNSNGQRVQSPTYYPSAPRGATARCVDGTYSFSTSRRGTCSHHGGVAQWL